MRNGKTRPILYQHISTLTERPTHPPMVACPDGVRNRLTCWLFGVNGGPRSERGAPGGMGAGVRPPSVEQPVPVAQEGEADGPDPWR